MSGLLVVGLATSLDRYAWLPPVSLGAVNRPRRVHAQAGGKGLNAVRAASALGVPVRAVALAGGDTGRTVRALAPPLDVRFVESGAETRQCLCLLSDDGVLTEFYEPVLPVPPSVWPPVLDAVSAALPGADLVALSGRVPPGLPADALGQLVAMAVAAGKPVLVDSDGPALVEAARHGPTMLKVNEHEAVALGPFDAVPMIVTTGATGAYYRDPDGHRVTVTHDPIPGALPVGSGDSFLAGLAAALLNDAVLPAALLDDTGLPAALLGDAGLPAALLGDADLPAALRFAAAAARANARHFVAASFTRADVEAELSSVTAG